MSDAVFALGEESGWTEQAACRGMDTSLFFSTQPARIERAKRVCADCPVRIPCLVDALERGECYGVWGGLTGDERAELSQATA